MRLVKSQIFIVAMCGALGLAACGGGDDDDDADDGSTDVGDDDGSTDVGDDDGADDDGGTVNPDGVDNTYVIDTLTVPSSGPEAADVALDIDGDGDVENVVGGLFGLIATAAGLDISGTVNEQLQLGSIILLANLKATDLADATGVGMYVYLGDDPDPAPCLDDADPTSCGQHLQGDGSFGISADSPLDAVVVGETTGGQFVGGPGSVTIELSLSALAAPLQLTLVNAKVDVAVAADGLSGGILGGAITTADVNDRIIPAVVDVVNGILDEDGCDPEAVPCCPEGSTGTTLLQFLDTEPEGGDCIIGVEEVANNSLVSSTLGNPDLDLEGDDGINDAISIGVGFTAVGGLFTPPAP